MDVEAVRNRIAELRWPFARNHAGLLPGTAGMLESLLREVEHYRALLAADENRVRNVVREACEEAWSLDREEVTQGQTERIAARAAKQLATAAGLSEDERNHLLSVRALLRERNAVHADLWSAEIATIDRLLVTGAKP
jgi:hypothetical protein